jgi:hypothetical protein
MRSWKSTSSSPRSRAVERVSRDVHLAGDGLHRNVELAGGRVSLLNRGVTTVVSPLAASPHGWIPARLLLTSLPVVPLLRLRLPHGFCACAARAVSPLSIGFLIRVGLGRCIESRLPSHSPSSPSVYPALAVLLASLFSGSPPPWAWAPLGDGALAVQEPSCAPRTLGLWPSTAVSTCSRISTWTRST